MVRGVSIVVVMTLLMGLVTLDNWANSVAGNRTQSLPNELDFESVRTDQLALWPFYGGGHRSSEYGPLIFSEGEDSTGVMLVSPDVYCGDIVVRFDIQALTAATVLMTHLGVMDVGAESLTFPDDYDASVSYMFDNMSMYSFVYHAATQNQPGPALHRRPSPDRMPVSAARWPYVKTARYHSIEVGRVGAMVYLSADGQRVLEWIDPAPFLKGHIVFGLKGTGNERAAALIRNVKIYNQSGSQTCTQIKPRP